MKHFSEAEVEEIINDHSKNNLAIYRIALKNKSHSQTICNLLKKRGIKIKQRSEITKLKNNFKEKEKFRISFLRENGLSIKEISNKTNFTFQRISNFLKQNNYINSFNEKSCQEIFELYNSGFSFKKIKKNYPLLCFSTLKKILKSNGTETRKRLKNEINENYFNKIDSHPKAYFLGLLMADGCVIRNRKSQEKNNVGRFCISLQERDGYILDSFKKELNYEGVVRFLKREKPRQNQFQLSICNKKLSQDLLKLNLTPDKSFNLEPPNSTQLPDEFINSFILGYFDGDGSICFYTPKPNQGRIKPCFSIISSKNFVDFVSKVFKDKFNLNFQTVARNCKNNKKIYTTKTASQSSMEVIYNFLYKDCPFFLKRKRDKFLEIFKILDIN